MVKIEYLHTLKGADRYGSCMGCGKNSAEDIWMSRIKISYDDGGNEHGVLNGDSMNGKWISCDDLLPSPSYKGLNGFVLCHTEGRVEWGRYTSYVWYGMDGIPIRVSAWYDTNYIGLIEGIQNVQV